jgi:hypothetical protein
MSNRYKSKRRSSKPINLSLLIVLGGAIVIAAGALLVFSGGGSSTVDPSFRPEVTGQPALKADQERVDLGNVRLGEWVSVAFQLTNIGDRPLFFTETPYVEVVEGC